MKKITLLGLSLITAVGVAATTVHAAPQDGARDGHGRHHSSRMGHQQRGDLTARQLQHLDRAVELSDDQKAVLSELFERQKQEMATLRNQHRTEMLGQLRGDQQAKLEAHRAEQEQRQQQRRDGAAERRAERQANR
ncbi:hypothetical protein [Isoalcanivorax beigongshangi]|uniref:LTXXQ motif family protein n=1 Tax=Isoalcanivorax beigongshangi TaxID=3238810 RepID=A0ABV4AIV6_9GAMM